MAKKQNTTIKLKGTLWYYTPNKRSSFSTEENPRYEIQLGNLEDFKENADVLKMLDLMGANVKAKEGLEDRGKFITGRSKWPISTIDSQKNPVSKDLGIGNGSVAYALFELYPTPKSQISNYGFGIRKVQIIDLVEYEKEHKDPTDDIFAVEDGYVATEETIEAPFEATQATEVDALDDEIEL